MTKQPNPNHPSALLTAEQIDSIEGYLNSRKFEESCAGWGLELVRHIRAQDARIAAALAIHRAEDVNDTSPWCTTCGQVYPCQTVRALEGATDA